MMAHIIAGLVGLGCAAAADPAFPIYSEQFIVQTKEYSSSGDLVLNETLDWDVIARRTHMKAEGSILAGGVLEQINRCDAGWETGWFAQASSMDPQSVSACRFRGMIITSGMRSRCCARLCC